MTSKKQTVLKKLKKFQRPLERFVFPVILLLWPLVPANQGITVMDTTYSLANYTYPESVNGTWKFATLLANALGSFLAGTPLGNSMLAMNIACSLLLSVTALVSYFALQRMIAGWMVFIGEFLALSLAWCPPVILYNTLTYLLLTFGCLCLFRAVSSVPETRKWYLAAGFFLGLNVTVRFSNLAEAALILALWFWCGVTGKKFRGGLVRTLWCLFGYLVGFGIPVVISMLVYGPGAYFSMIPKLFGIGGSNSDYTLGGMLASTLSAYGQALQWFLILIPCILMGVVMFLLPLWRDKRWLKKLIYIAGCLFLIRFFWGRGMFTTNYHDYWSWFSWGMLLLIMTLILCVIFMAGGFSANPDERFLSAMVLVLILVLPLGSNNYTFPIMNCLFVIAPSVLWFLRRIWQETRGVGGHFAWHAMAVMILGMVLLQGALFHVNFAFRDGTDGTPRNATVEDNTITAGMYTTSGNARELSLLTALVRDNDLAGTKTIVFGDAPGLHYLLQLPPAIDTAWPDLDSYSTEQFAEQLEELDAAGETPLVILHFEEAQSDSAGEKMEKLLAFLDAHGYDAIYGDGVYEVYAVR